MKKSNERCKISVRFAHYDAAFGSDLQFFLNKRMTEVTNRNLINGFNFEFTLKRTPNVVYFCQAANLPGVSTQRVDINNPFTKIPFQGDHLDWEELRITFLVDEDLNNWKEIFNWIVGYTFPQNFAQYRQAKKDNIPETKNNSGIECDASLILKTNLSNPRWAVRFRNISPITLSGLEFKTTDQSVTYMEATTTFAYTYYTIEAL